MEQMEVLFEETDLNRLARGFALTTSEVVGYLNYAHDHSKDNELLTQDQLKLLGALRNWRPAYGSERDLYLWIQSRERTLGKDYARVLYKIFLTEMATRRYIREPISADAS